MVSRFGRRPAERKSKDKGEKSMRFNKKDLFTIPNIIGYVRILLIPVLVSALM